MRAALTAMLGALAALGPAPAAAEPAPLVYVHIAGPDLAGQRAFYRELLGIESDEGGNFAVPATPRMNGILQVEPSQLGPETGSALYFGVPDVTAAQARAVELGGAIVFPRIEIPGVVVLGLVTDPAGNRVGLIEWRDGKAVVPPVPPPAPPPASGGS